MHFPIDSLYRTQSEAVAGTAPAEGVRWDLSDLYKSPDDERLRSDIVEVLGRAASFAEKYRGVVESGITPERMAEAMRAYEELLEAACKPLAQA